MTERMFGYISEGTIYSPEELREQAELERQKAAAEELASKLEKKSVENQPISKNAPITINRLTGKPYSEND